MKCKPLPKERNQFVAAALFRKAGSHKLSARKKKRSDNKLL
jgi:hypothetical protein